MRNSLKIVIAITTALVLSGAAIALRRKSRSQSELAPQQVAALEQKERQNRLTFQDRAQLAKSRRQNRITIPNAIVLYPVAQSPEELDQLLRNYSVVIAQPVEVRSYATDNPQGIRSWYRFAILHTLLQHAPLPVYGEFQVPQELNSIAPNEFLMSTAGGTVEVDGVQITQYDQAVRPFDINQRYLLLVSLDPATRIGRLMVPPQGSLPLKADNALDPRGQASLLYSVINTYHAGSIMQLEYDLQKIPTLR